MLHPHCLLGRSEIEAGEIALEQVQKQLAQEQSKLRDAETKLKAAQQAVTDKEAMIHAISDEVERIKGASRGVRRRPFLSDASRRSVNRASRAMPCRPV